MKAKLQRKCLFCDKPAVALAGNQYNLFCKECQKTWQNKLNNIFKTKDGQDVLHVIMYLSKLLEPTYTGNAETHFNEGVRFLGTWLFKEVMKSNRDNGIRVIEKLIT